jgi:hypothetical protein
MHLKDGIGGNVIENHEMLLSIGTLNFILLILGDKPEIT